MSNMDHSRTSVNIGGPFHLVDVLQEVRVADEPVSRRIQLGLMDPFCKKTWSYFTDTCMNISLCLNSLSILSAMESSFLDGASACLNRYALMVASGLGDPRWCSISDNKMLTASSFRLRKWKSGIPSNRSLG